MSDETRRTTAPADTTHDTRTRHDAVAAPDHTAARERFGGLNAGASFFGWLVAMGTAILLSGIIGAVVAGLDQSYDLTAQIGNVRAGQVGLFAALALLVLLIIAYFTGGYVAGRMSRYDGGRQGAGVWGIGLVVTVVTAVVGVVAGQQYDVLGRVSVPTIPVPTDQLTLTGIAVGVIVLLTTLFAAMAGGKLGHRYHTKVDRAVGWRA